MYLYIYLYLRSVCISKYDESPWTNISVKANLYEIDTNKVRIPLDRRNNACNDVLYICIFDV